MKASLKLASTILALCALPAIALDGDLGSEVRDQQAIAAIKVQAGLAERSPKDWFGKKPREFKSGYGKVDDDTKATFAFDLGKFIEGEGETPANVTSKYIPFSRRDKFAESWWLRHSSDYKSKAPWDRDYWRYE